MQLRYKFEIMEAGGLHMAVPVGDGADGLNAMLELNGVGAKMLERIGESQTPEEALHKLCEDYPDEPLDEVADKLGDFLNRLVSEGLLIA